MTSTDKRRLLVILAVLAVFLLPLIINGPITGADQPMIPLGLDLRGGVDVSITVDTDHQARQILNSLKGEINPELRRVLRGAGSELRLTPEDDGPGLILRLDNPSEDAAAVHQALQQFVTGDVLVDFLVEDLRSARGAVLQLDPNYLGDEVEAAIERATRIVKERVDALGVAQSDVRREGISDIRIQLPGTHDPEYVINNLVRPANLEFRLAYPDQDITMEQYLETMITPEGDLRPGARLDPGYGLEYRVLDPGEVPSEGLPGTTIVTRRDEQVEIPVAWYLLESDPVIWGEHLRTVRAQPGGTTGMEMVVGFELNAAGRRLFARTTEENVGRRMAIVLEDTVRSAPVIRDAITMGRGEISGDFTIEEAQALENVLKTGSLPARLETGQLSVVGASLGEDSIRSGVRAGLLGAAGVLVFMLLYYSASGALAIIAVLINVFLVMGVLSLIRATLTLPGIAGIILTIGMAVDANVLIFERVREELRAGKSLRNAITHGFSNAFSAIVDANVTTLITALVLLQFGFGPIRGFALTMTFGIMATLFTGLFVTQAMMGIYFNVRERLPLGKMHFLPDHTELDFMGMRRASFALSVALVLASVGDLVYNGGPHLGVDFSGGVQVEVALDAEMGQGEIEGALRDGGFGAPRVQSIRHRIEEDAETPDPGGAVATDRGFSAVSSFLIRISQSEMIEGVDSVSDESATESLVLSIIGEVADAGTQVRTLGSRQVTAETGAQLRWTAVGIVITAMVFIFAYVAIRFDSIYGVAALVALFHDVFITLGVITILNVDLSLDVVAALLTIMGYSLNDTIVVFDRMRENRHAMEGGNLRTVINLSINQVLSRTLITTGTTLLAVGSLLVLGGPGIHDFALTLMIGFLIGTYSSVFIAAPLVYGRMQHRLIIEAKGA